MANVLNEHWRPVPGYEGAYSVSDLGHVRSERRTIARAGSPYIVPERMLKLSNDGRGYSRVSLSVGSAVRYVSVHKLVMLAFVGPRPEDADICHADGNPLNNRLDNLRYDTRAANIVDCQQHGNFSEAETHPVAILTNDQALAIYNAIGESAESLAGRCGVSVAVIQQIWRGDTWKSVTGGRNVIKKRGRATYLRTILTKAQADAAIFNRNNRTARKDGRGIRPTADALGVDRDVITALYAAVDARKAIIYAE